MQVFHPVLYFGVTQATFQPDGKNPALIDWWNVKASDGAIAGAAIFKTLAEI